MWGKKKKDTDTTTIKRTTKIKETYTVPASNMNPETVVSTKSKVKEEQTFNQNQYQTSDIRDQSGNVQIEKDMGSRNRSRSSSSEREREKIRMESSLGNPNNYGLIRDAPVVGSNAPGGLNETRTYQTTLEGDLSESLHLGKNLYGETGYASPYYMVQQPFPGQTVYVEKWKQNIPEHTRSKFLRSSHPETYQEQTYSYQKENLQNPIPLVGQNNQTILRTQNYQLPQTNKSNFESKLPYPENNQTTQKVNLESNINSPTKKTFQNPFASLFSKKDNTKKDQTEVDIKQKTKIDQKYNLPSQNVNQTINVPTRDTDIRYQTQTQNPNLNYSQKPLDYSQKPVNYSQQPVNYSSQPVNYSQQPAVTSSLGYNQPQTTTSNVQYGQNYDTRYQTQTNAENQLKTSNLEKNIDSKGSTVIKQKTTIKENYTIPSQNININSQPVGVTVSTGNQVTSNQNQGFSQQMPIRVSVENPNVGVQQSNVGNLGYQSSNVPSQGMNLGMQKGEYRGSGDTKNLQYLQNKYGQTDYQFDVNTRQQSQYEASNLQTHGQNTGNMNMNSGMTNMRQNVDMSRQSATIQQEYAPTSTGFGQTRYRNVNQSNIVREQGGMVYGGGPLGKNLYGETGYASFEYTLQQPFPGQTVYVPESPSKISNRTRERFSQPTTM